MTTIDYNNGAAILAVAKIIGVPVSDETRIFRLRDTCDFAYKNNSGMIKLARPRHYRSTNEFIPFDLWIAFAWEINTIAVYVPTEATSQ